MATLIDELLRTAWPHGVPERLDALIHRQRCGALLADFKLGLVFPFAPGGQPVRLALSAQGERERWIAGITRQWPSDRLTRFLDQAPAHTRLMVDSDGSDRAVVYLDDLQDVDHGLRAPQGLELMCATLTLPGGAEAVVTRHTEPPLDLLSAPLRGRCEALREAGAEGLWALRWQQDRVVGLLWITESRWRDNVAESSGVVAGLSPSPAYEGALAVVAQHGRQGYPDALEIIPDGGLDVTLGII